MGRQRKRCPGSFPTFCGKQTNIRGCYLFPSPLRGRDERNSLLGVGGGGVRESRARGPPPSLTLPARGGNGRKEGSLPQLALQRFDPLRERDVLCDQGLDLAYGMQDRGVVASPEPATDFGQRTQCQRLRQIH